MEREAKELRRASGALKLASAFFARAALDRRPRPRPRQTTLGISPVRRPGWQPESSQPAAAIAAAGQSTRAPESLTILAHLAPSVRITFWNSSGLLV